MEPIKIEVSVKLNLSDDAKNFIASLLSNSSKPAVPTAKPATSAAKPTTAPASAKPAEKPVEKKAEVSIEDVRKALASKVAGHRAEIKEKLDELGAPSVTKLDPAKYQEMLDFLNALD